MGRSRYLVKNTTMIGAGSIITKLTQFIVLSLCTRCLTTGEYGIADICVATAALLYPVFSLDISESVFRFIMDKPQNEKPIVSFAISVAFLGGAVAFFLTPIMLYIPSIGRYWPAIALLSGLESFQILFKEYVRGKEDGKKYVLGGITNSFIQIVACFLFVYYLKYGVWGYFFSLVLGFFGEAIYLSASTRIIDIFSVKEIKKTTIIDMLAYSMPLIPNTIMWWIVSIADRYFILYMVGDAAAGLYSVAAKIPALISVVMGIFFKAWQMSAIDAEKQDDVSEYTSKVFNYLWVIGAISISLVLISLRMIMSILVAEEYYDAWGYATVLIVSAGFSSLQAFIGTSYTVYKDSIGCLKSTAFTAILNIILNYFFIVSFGVEGAAYSTLLSFVFVTIYRFFDTRKYLVIHVDIVRIAISYCLLIVASIVALLKPDFFYPIAVLSLIAILIINKNEAVKLLTVFKRMISGC